jgi:hypothetical protein
MPRFVLLEHDHPELHWDFMLEHEGVLKTWRLASMPSRAGESIPAVPLGDHRIAYLDYEGPVSGDRGNVKRCAAGTYELIAGVFGDDVLELTLRTANWECRALLASTLDIKTFSGGPKAIEAPAARSPSAPR